MKGPSTAFAAIPETKEPVMTLFGKSLLALGLAASLSATSAQAFQAATLAPSDAAIAKAGYQTYGAPSYGYGGYNSYGSSYGYGSGSSYGYGSSYGDRQSYGYRPSQGYGYNSYGY
jgi:hypothetical protein